MKFGDDPQPIQAPLTNFSWYKNWAQNLLTSPYNASKNVIKPPIVSTPTPITLRTPPST